MSLQEHDSDPMAGLVNLFDVMLVFCVGLIIALVMSWNLENMIFVDVEKGQEIKDMPKMEDVQGEGYQEMGRVYKDPETGQLIMIEEGSSEE